MNPLKPDLLVVLTLILTMGVIVTSFGGKLLEGMNVQAAPLANMTGLSHHTHHKLNKK